MTGFAFMAACISSDVTGQYCDPCSLVSRIDQTLQAGFARGDQTDLGHRKESVDEDQPDENDRFHKQL